MRYLRYISVGLAFWVMAACSEGSDESPASGNIQLGATVGNLQIDSRVEADAYESGETLDADVWFRIDGEYKNEPNAVDDTYLPPVHTTVEFNGNTAVKYNSRDVIYPTDDSPVYCIGMSPKSDATDETKQWSAAADNKSVSHAIDGVQDLMFAPEISGSWNSHFPKQEYEHLLTWIKITICAASHEAIETWGKIKQITINSAKTVSVNLEADPSSRYTYSGATSIYTMPDGGPGVALTTTIQEVGSVFCSPEVEYTVTVTAEDKNGAKIEKNVKFKDLKIIDVNDINGNGDTEEEITIDQANVGLLRGTCYVLSLYFRSYNVIEWASTLNSWSDQYEDLYPRPSTSN